MLKLYLSYFKITKIAQSKIAQRCNSLWTICARWRKMTQNGQDPVRWSNIYIFSILSILFLSCFGVFWRISYVPIWFYIKYVFCIRRMHDGFACRKKVRLSVDTCILNMYAGICEYSAGRARLQWVPIATMSLQPSARQRFSESSTTPMWNVRRAVTAKPRGWGSIAPPERQ